MLRDRAQTAGLSPPMIADILGLRSLSGAHRALDRGDRGALALIAAWEIMTAEQRRAWLDELGVPSERPRRGRPRKTGVI